MTRTVLLLLAGLTLAQDSTPKERIKSIRATAKEGPAAIQKLVAWLNDPEPEVRRETVKAIVTLGTLESLNPLTKALSDSDPEVQIRAIDGLANFYVPGYVEQGLTAQLKHASSVLGLKLSDKSGMAVEPDVKVRREVVDGVAALIASGANMTVRADAARAAGTLRARAALPKLIEALRSKDDSLIYESLIAIQKIGDPSAGYRIVFLLRDLNERVQAAAIETAGLLKTKEALTDLSRLVDQKPINIKVKREALAGLALIGDPSSRPVFEKYFEDKDESLRASAAEGLGRVSSASDRDKLDKAFDAEKKMPPRLALAFAAVCAGNTSLAELRPLRYLVNTLNSKAWKGVAQPYLEELARAPAVRAGLVSALNAGLKDERLALLQIFGRTGTRDMLPLLEGLGHDPDAEVAQESLRAVRQIRARSM